MKRIVLGCLALGLVSLAFAAPPPVKTVESGRGPTVVLLHSMGGARATWNSTVKELLGRHRVVAVDIPGHGESPLPDPFSLEAAAESVGQILGTLPPDSTIVVGQGMGGVIALLALTAHPERARGLVLIDALLLSPYQLRDEQRAATIQSMDENYDGFLSSTFGKLGRDSIQSAQIHALAAQVPPATMKAYFAAILGLDATPAIRSARLPILAIGTERIWPADRDSSTFVKQMGYQGAVDLTTKRLARCGLLVASEQPDSLADIIHEFAARHIGHE